MDAPRLDSGSKEVELTVREMADRYFGRPVGNENQFYARMRQQNMISKWLHYWSDVGCQCLQLMQQFMDDEIYFRVVGSRQAEPIRVGRDEIQGQFDVMVYYNVAIKKVCCRTWLQRYIWMFRFQMSLKTRNPSQTFSRKPKSNVKLFRVGFLAARE